MLSRHGAIHTTIRAALLGVALGGALGCAFSFMGEMPVAPLTVSIALGLGLVLPLVTWSMLADLRLARLGSREEKRAAAAKPLGRLTIASSRAAVAIEAGDLESAARAIAHLPEVALKDGIVSLVRARYALARGEPDALEALLAWEAPKLRVRVGVAETCRYGAYLLASALVSQPDDERRRRTAARLLAAPDPEERAYGAWLVAFAADDDEAQAQARLRLDSNDLLLGAVLARHEGLSEVASALEARAAQVALQQHSGPYRG
jgi:hypothetical protein